MQNILIGITIIGLLTSFSFSTPAHKSVLWNQMSIADKQQWCIYQANQISAHQNFKTQTAETFVKRFAWLCIFDYNEYGVPASVKLSQGWIESACGTSEHTVQNNKNNYFCIKCSKKKHNNSECFPFHDDSPKDRFIRYSSPFNSFREHTFYLQRRFPDLFQYTGDKNQYSGYKEWCHGLKRYATNPKYSTILKTNIEKNHLNDYDVRFGQ